MNMTNPSDFRTLQILLCVFAAASLAHFIHNAEFLAEYPGLPPSWTRMGVYGAWLALTLLGLVGWCTVRAGYVLPGLILIGCYAMGGMDSLGHYVLAPFAAHTPAMHVSILSEVGSALLLFFETGRLLLGRMLARARVRH